MGKIKLRSNLDRQPLDYGIDPCWRIGSHEPITQEGQLFCRLCKKPLTSEEATAKRKKITRDFWRKQENSQW